MSGSIENNVTNSLPAGADLSAASRKAVKVNASGQLVLVDADGRLRLRPAEVVRTEGDDALVRATLAPGERVCVSSLDVVLEGMEVAPLEIPPEEALGGVGAS